MESNLFQKNFLIHSYCFYPPNLPDFVRTIAIDNTTFFIEQMHSFQSFPFLFIKRILFIHPRSTISIPLFYRNRYFLVIHTYDLRPLFDVYIIYFCLFKYLDRSLMLYRKTKGKVSKLFVSRKLYNSFLNCFLKILLGCSLKECKS